MLTLPSDQYLRTAQLVMGDLLFNGHLNFSIEVQQEGNYNPANCSIKAYNLTTEHRKWLDVKKRDLHLSAGYNGQNKIIFGGTVFYIENARDGADIVTTFHSQCGLPAVNQAAVSISGALDDYQIYQACANVLSAFGVVKGHLSASVIQMFQNGRHSKGFTDLGYTSKFLATICKDHGLRWNISGLPPALNIYNKGEYEDSQTIVLSSESGLIGTPTLTIQDGVYSVKALLNAELSPGRRVKVVSRELSLPSDIKISKSVHSGDTLEGDWFTTFEARVPGL
jgi:hypothetical protein